MDIFGIKKAKARRDISHKKAQESLDNATFAYARLLAVARAAYIYDCCMDEDIERKERLLLIMRAALVDVKDLL